MSDDERIIEIEVERLRTFPNHPFKVTDDGEMDQLTASIKQYGITRMRISLRRNCPG